MAEPVTRRLAQASGPDITFDEWPGDGPLVVLAHGGGQTRHSWGGTASVLADHGFRVISIDLRGHGDSAWDTEGDYSMAAFAADAVTVIDHVGGSTHWVGASLGGMTGLHAVEASPESFASLTLVDITPRPASAGVDRILEFMADKAHEGFATLEEAADAIAAYQPHRPRPSNLNGLAKNLRKRDARWYWHWDPRFLTTRGGPGTEHARDQNHDQMEQIARSLTLPVLLVRGKLSDLVTQAEVDAFLEMVPHASYVDVANAAHMIAGDRNDVFTDAVVDFLRNQSGATPR